MSVTPPDIRQQQFRRAFRGFDKAEVTSFLVAVADDYEKTLEELDSVRRETVRLESIVSECREQEASLRKTLMAAQKLADDIRDGAHEDAQRIVGEAQSRSDQVLARAQDRLDDVQREIDGLLLKRHDVETTIEMTIQGLRRTIDYVHEQDLRDRDERPGVRPGVSPDLTPVPSEAAAGESREGASGAGSQGWR